MIRVFIPSQLESYTSGVREVMLDLGSDSAPHRLLQVMDALDRMFPGLKFRIVDEQGNIRRHIAVFVGETLVRDLDAALAAEDRVQIVGALSGG